MRDFSLDFFSRDVHLSQKEELFINQGRRSGLKIRRWRQRTGSSPVTGTIIPTLI